MVEIEQKKSEVNVRDGQDGAEGLKRLRVFMGQGRKGRKRLVGGDTRQGRREKIRVTIPSGGV